MSNEFVMVPRELAERISASIGYEERDELREILAKPATRQGEPVLYYKSLVGAEAKPTGECYSVFFTPMPGHQPLFASAEPSAPVEIDDLRIHLEAMCKLWPEDLSDDGSGRMGFKSEVAATVAKARAALVRKP